MSAAMLRVLATSSRPTTPNSAGRGNARRMFAAKPRPVTNPMRALTTWIAAISGSVNTTLHNME